MTKKYKITTDYIVKYFSMLFRKLLSIGGALSTLVSIVLFFFGNQILPETIPSFFLGIMFFTITLIGCGFAVWFDQLKLTGIVEKHLRELKSKIPSFQLESVDLVRYSVSESIEECRNRLSKLKSDKDQTKKDEQPNPANPFFGLSTALASLRSITTLPSIGMYREETDDEKIERIEKYLIELEVF